MSDAERKARKAAYMKVWREENKSNRLSYREAYEAANADKIKARKAIWRVSNKTSIAAYMAEYRDTNKEKISAKTAEWHVKNPEKAAGYAIARYSANREEMLAYSAAWRKAHPIANRIKSRKYYARKSAATGLHTEEEVLDLYKRQKGKCGYCRVSLKKGYHIDHIKALAKGGSNWISNIQLLCATCNRRKHAKDSIIYARQMGLLL